MKPSDRRILAVIPLVLCGHLAAAGATFDPATSPFADKPCNSYSNFKDAAGNLVQPIWGTIRPYDFGSREVTFVPGGTRALRPPPAPGVHPRIFFAPDDLPDIRRRVKETRCGQEAWKNILSWTLMMKGKYDDSADYAQPDRWNGGFGGLHGRVPLFRLGVPRESGRSPYNHSEAAAAIYSSLVDGTATEFPPYYWNVFALEAFRCLIEDDGDGARDLAKATVTAMKLDQATRAQAMAAKGEKGPSDQPVGAFQLAFTYDLIFGWFTPEQKAAIHAELADTTWYHDNYGTFNTATASRSNWATFSYWLFEVLAIEGEPGFNELKVRGMYRGWRNLLTYGWFQSGATYEGEAKNQLGMDGIIPFVMREKLYGMENLCDHPYLRAYADRFLPQSINPMLTGFHKYDLLGGSRTGSGGFTPCDFLGLKFLFPADRTIDWLYRKAIGENYDGVPDRPDGYFNALLFFAIFSTDFDPANGDVEKLGLGNTFFCGERAILMTRSSWDTDALMLNMHTRQANGGHPFADRNSIMVAGAGRIWSPNGYASFRTFENSVVCIDGKSQKETAPGRMVDFKDTADATFAVGDAKYCWDWSWQTLNKKGGYYTIDEVKAGVVQVPPGWEPENHAANDFAYLKLPYPYLDTPEFHAPSWILPTGAISPVVRQANYPVQRAFRTAGIVRGDHPYALVVDDIQKDGSVHRYDWTLALESDIQIAKIDKRADGTMDIFLTGSDPDQKLPRPKLPLPATLEDGAAIPPHQPMLLVRVLNRTVDPSKPAEDPTIVELPNAADPKKYSPIRRLVIPADAIAPDFKVLLYPHRNGQPVPSTAWDADHRSVAVGFGSGNDVISFAPSADSKTDVSIRRSGKELVAVNTPIQPLADK